MSTSQTPQTPLGASDAGRLRTLARARSRIAVTLTLAMIAVYFGFIALVAFDKPLLARLVTPGLSLGILLGALVIVASWLLTFVYVRWANTHYDAELRDIGAGRGERR
jgi:uncharacterized membrane protein (DUF485 family)